MTYCMMVYKQMTEILSEADMTDIKDAFILNRGGKIVAYYGTNELEPSTMTVMTSNIWSLYENKGLIALKEDPLEVLLLHCSVGKLGIKIISGFLLCIRTKSKVEMGYLYAKLNMLAHKLQEPLKETSEF